MIVIDGLGIGGALDAALYGDEGSNTYASVADNLSVPTLVKLGLNNINGVLKPHYPIAENPIGCYARLHELSAGKDTITGHWEMMGIVNKVAYPTYPNGFPNEVIDALEKSWGVNIIGNMVASGTDIIRDLGPLHIKTGKPIVYTSADSVLQIASHIDVIPLDRLYKMCAIAREIMINKHNVARIIARPFTGGEGGFTRTADRRDYAVKIPDDNILNKLQALSIPVYGYGKINSIFDSVGINYDMGGHSNEEIMDLLLNGLKDIDNGFLFINLVDTDMLYGHRNDVEGFKSSLELLDKRLQSLIKILKKNDIILITGDHGCDPKYNTSDHTRENTPLLLYGKSLKRAIDLGELNGFNNIGEYILDVFSNTEQSRISKLLR